MSTEKWTAGGIAAGFAAFGSEVNTACPDGSFLLSSIVCSNGTAQDMYGDISINISSLGVTANPSFVQPYIFPLNEDGSTYGDGTGSRATFPGDNYRAGPAIQVTSGGHLVGSLARVPLPPRDFKWGLYFKLGAALPASGNLVYTSTWNRSIA